MTQYKTTLGCHDFFFFFFFAFLFSEQRKSRSVNMCGWAIRCNEGSIKSPHDFFFRATFHVVGNCFCSSNHFSVIAVAIAFHALLCTTVNVRVRVCVSAQTFRFTWSLHLCFVSFVVRCIFLSCVNCISPSRVIKDNEKYCNITEIMSWLIFLFSHSFPLSPISSTRTKLFSSHFANALNISKPIWTQMSFNSQKLLYTHHLHQTQLVHVDEGKILTNRT